MCGVVIVPRGVVRVYKGVLEVGGWMDVHGVFDKRWNLKNLNQSRIMGGW